jgi:hypothetical protein
MKASKRWILITSMENKKASHGKLFTVNLLVEESLEQYAEQQKTTEQN